MPRYYFNICDGVRAPDETGIELANWHDARVEAIRLAGAILKGDAQRLALSDDWHLEVADERGLMLFRFDFISHEAPVLASQRRIAIKLF